MRNIFVKLFVKEVQGMSFKDISIISTDGHYFQQHKQLEGFS